MATTLTVTTTKPDEKQQQQQQNGSKLCGSEKEETERGLEKVG